VNTLSEVAVFLGQVGAHRCHEDSIPEFE